MSRFKRIKNTSTKKSSVSIDEKIDASNKELEKTECCRREPTNYNSGVYSSHRHLFHKTLLTRSLWFRQMVPNSSGVGVDGTFTQRFWIIVGCFEGDAPD